MAEYQGESLSSSTFLSSKYRMLYKIADEKALKFFTYYKYRKMFSEFDKAFSFMNWLNFHMF